MQLKLLQLFCWWLEVDSSQVVYLKLENNNLFKRKGYLAFAGDVLQLDRESQSHLAS